MVPAEGVPIVYMVSEAVLSPPSILPTRQTLSHHLTFDLANHLQRLHTLNHSPDQYQH